MSTQQRFRIALLAAKRQARIAAGNQIKVLVLMYRRHQDWARRSGYAPMEWPDFKKSRLTNPLSRAAIAKATGSAS